MPAGKFDFELLLGALAQHQVEFIVIGGVSAYLHGAAYLTFDLDIVPKRTTDNLERLATALTQLSAHYREHTTTRLTPNAQRLNTPGHHLLMTDAGALDVLGSIVGGRDYERLLPHTILVQVSNEMQVRMLDLPTLIQIKQETGRPKDLAALPLLQATLLASQDAEETSQE